MFLVILVWASTASAYTTGDTPGFPLVLPFHHDQDHKLSQGYAAPGNFSHFAGTLDEFALDLKGDVNITDVAILAAHAGTVDIVTSNTIDCGTVNESLAGVPGINGGYGHHLYVYHENGCRSHYAHLSSIEVSDGQYIDQGDLLGYEGSEGCSTARHLHFSMQCLNSYGAYVAIKPEPISEYTGLGSMVGQTFGDGEASYAHYPVGTAPPLFRKASRTTVRARQL